MYEMECYLEFQGLYKNFHDGHLKQLMMGLMMAEKNKILLTVVI